MDTLELITNAYYLSGIVSRGYETVSGTYASDGLEILNDILSEKSISSALIPYYTHTTFDTVVGQEEYTIPNLVNITDLTFNIGTVRYPMVRDSQKRYFGSGRVDDLKSLPFHYYAERQLIGMILYLYFIPQQIFEMKITGKFELQELGLFENLDPIFNRFYKSYLKYILARRLCDFFGQKFPQELMPTLRGLESTLTNMVGLDLTIDRKSMFRRSNFDYVQANLGKGWEP